MWITLVLKYWRLFILAGLLLIASGTSWYITKNYYQAIILKEKMEYQNTLILLQEKRKQEERRVVNEYQAKKGIASTQYNDVVKFVRDNYCMPRSTESTAGSSSSPKGNRISCTVAEAVTRLMYIAQEQTAQLVACQNLSKPDK